MKWSDDDKILLENLVASKSEITVDAVLSLYPRLLAYGSDAVGRRMRRIRNPAPRPEDVQPGPLSDLEREILKMANAGKKRRGVTHVLHMADVLDVAPSVIRDTVEELQAQRYHIEVRENIVDIPLVVKTGFRKIPLEHFQDGEWYHFGVVSDTHLSSKHCRLDVLNAAYDFFASQGIRRVLHAGNWIDGERHAGQRNELIVPCGVENQINYFLANYPQRDGIETYYIDGDDHEGAYTQDIGLNTGQHLEDTAKRRGRNDLHFLGYLEVDIPFYAQRGKTPAILRLMHGGGGSSYSVSYILQKIIESLSGGEKPQVMLCGHFHKQMYFHWRNIHTLHCASTVDQSIFMRKLRLGSAVGFHTIKFKVDRDGSINRFIVEYNPFYNEGYYIHRYTVGEEEELVAEAKSDSKWYGMLENLASGAEMDPGDDLEAA